MHFKIILCFALRFFFKIGFHLVSEVGLKVLILVPQSSECRNYSVASLGQDQNVRRCHVNDTDIGSQV